MKLGLQPINLAKILKSSQCWVGTKRIEFAPRRGVPIYIVLLKDNLAVYNISFRYSIPSNSEIPHLQCNICIYIYFILCEKVQNRQ